MKRKSAESKKVLELAILKCLTGGRLTKEELKEVLEVSSAELFSIHGCDFIMSETIRMHSKLEHRRIQSQKSFTGTDDWDFS